MLLETVHAAAHKWVSHAFNASMYQIFARGKRPPGLTVSAAVMDASDSALSFALCFACTPNILDSLSVSSYTFVTPHPVNATEHRPCSINSRH